MTVGARAVVFDGKKVLLVRHTYIDGWYLPGGGVERGETFGAAICRELREEVGLAATAPRLFAVYLAEGEARRDDYVALYVVDAWSRLPEPPTDKEIAEWAFFPLDALPVDAAGEPLASPATRRRLSEIQAGRPTSEHW